MSHKISNQPGETNKSVSPPRPTQLHALLQRASHLTLSSTLISGAMRWFSLWLAALLAALMIDAAIGLAPWGLITLNLILFALLIFALVVGIRITRRLRYRPRQAARLVETTLGITDNRLINAVDLMTPQSSGMSSAHAKEHTATHEEAAAVSSDSLRAYAIRLGEELAATLDPRGVMDKQALHRAMKLAGLTLLVFAAAYITLPGMFHAVVPRLLAPHADLPPYTLVQFDVNVQPDAIYHGKSARIEVVLTGPTLPQQAGVVFDQPDGSKQRVPMWRVPDPPVQRQDADADNAAQPEAPTHARFVLSIDRAQTTRTFYIDTPQGRSHRYTLNVLPVPLFEQVIINHDYPDYTRWPDARYPLSAQGITALEDTKVLVTATSNVPLRKGRLILTPDKDGQDSEDSPVGLPVEVLLKPDADDPRRVRGMFEMSITGSFELSLIGADGTPSDEPLQGSLRSMKDRPPKVSIIEPDQRLIAPETWPVETIISASDDVGIRRLDLAIRVNDGQYEAIAFAPDAGHRNHPHFNAAHTFNFEAMNAKAGDVVNFFATAHDNKPPAGQSSRTSSHAILLITMDEYMDMARGAYQLHELLEEWAMFREELDMLKQQRDEIIAELKQLTDAIDAQDGGPTEAQAQRLAELQQQLEAYAEHVPDLFEALRRRADQPSLYEFEDPYKDMLRRLETALQPQAAKAMELQQALNDFQQSPGPSTLATLQQLLSRFEQQEQPFTGDEQREREQMAHDYEKLAMAGEMLIQTQNLTNAIEQQIELAQRMVDQLEQAPQQPATEQREQLEHYAREQQQLHERLEVVMKQLRDAAMAARDELPMMHSSAMNILFAIEQSQALTDQVDAVRLAREYDGSGAAKAAQRAADKLEALLSDADVGQMAGDAGDELDGLLALSRTAMMQSLQQIMDAQAMQMQMQMGLGPMAGGGAGFAGQFAQASVVGPQMPSLGESALERAARGRTGEDGRGRPGVSPDEQPRDAEVIRPDRTTPRGTVPAAMPDVPQIYRDLAEAYFLRLAEEHDESSR